MYTAIKKTLPILSVNLIIYSKLKLVIPYANLIILNFFCFIKQLEYKHILRLIV